jgi:predicted homoserine dehydrogenase-like protein
MIYHHLLANASRKTPVKAALIGAGFFGASVVAQSGVIPQLEFSAIADTDAEAGRRAFRRAGVAEEGITVCDSLEAALSALEQGKRVVAEDAMLLMELPVDIIVEATGNPEVGAQYAAAAIRSGKHVAMTNKETDSVVGPILQVMASRAGVIYTPVDGDQHGLLMGMAEWARTLGLPILCAGKARGYEYIYDRRAGEVRPTWGSKVQPISDSGRKYMDRIPVAAASQYVRERAAMLSSFPGHAPYDLCELVIAANALDLHPDIPEIHGPIVRTVEIAEALCPSDSGGMLGRSRGCIDIVSLLREPDEAGFGGGMFLVVGCEDEASRRALVNKGCLANTRGDALLLYRPFHLLGAESAISLLSAVLLGVSTGSADYRPRYDLIKSGTRGLKAGEVLGGDNDSSLRAELVPAVPLRDGLPLAAHLMTGRKLKRDVADGEVITADMVELSSDSTLLELRREQDAYFNTK